MNWMTTRQAAEYVEGKVSQQAIKVAARREYLKAGTTSKYVRKLGRDWQISESWPRLEEWKSRALPDTDGRLVELRGRVAELEAVCQEQRERIGELERELAGYGDRATPVNVGAGTGSAALVARLTGSDSALLDYYRRERVSVRALADLLGKSKSWVGDHLKAARQQAE